MRRLGKGGASLGIGFEGSGACCAADSSRIGCTELAGDCADLSSGYADLPDGFEAGCDRFCQNFPDATYVDWCPWSRTPPFVACMSDSGLDDVTQSPATYCCIAAYRAEECDPLLAACVDTPESEFCAEYCSFLSEYGCSSPLCSGGPGGGGKDTPGTTGPGAPPTPSPPAYPTGSSFDTCVALDPNSSQLAGYCCAAYPGTESCGPYGQQCGNLAAVPNFVPIGISTWDLVDACYGFCASGFDSAGFCE
jgi:hypothetical protein